MGFRSTVLGGERFGLQSERSANVADRFRLPDKGDQTVSDPFFVFGVAIKPRLQNRLLVADAQDDEGGVGEKDDKGEKWAEDEGNGEKEQDGGGVHGVADDAVKPGVHQLLAVLYLHCAGEIGVLLHDSGI